MGKEYRTIGYHKAIKEYADIIINENAFRLSHKDTEWLGNGVYFWEQPSDAEWWCKDRYKHYTIFQANLCCDSDLFLDLDDNKCMAIIIEFANDCQTLFSKSGLDASGNQKKFRTAVCNYYKEVAGILLMRYSFPSFESNTAGFPEDLVFRPQYCATNNSVIEHFEAIEEG